METKMVSVSSSNVSKVGYTDGGDLVVEFIDGSVYRYVGVEKFHYDALLESFSPGKYLGMHIKGKYEFEKLEEE